MFTFRSLDDLISVYNMNHLRTFFTEKYSRELGAMNYLS